MSLARWAVLSWVMGGIGWVITGLAGLEAVDGTGGFYAAEGSWLVVHLLVLVGLVGLVRSDAAGGASWGRNALLVAVAGRVVFLVAEVVAIIVADDEIALFPLAAVLTAAGMVGGGMAIVRSHRWRGLARYAPLAMGVYPFVAMFPVLAVTGERPDTALALWGLTIVGVGWAMKRSAVESPVERARNRASSRPATSPSSTAGAPSDALDRQRSPTPG